MCCRAGSWTRPPCRDQGNARARCRRPERRLLVMELRHALTASPLDAAAPSLPRLSRRAGFWAVAFSFTAVAAFSTTPSPLYGLYERQLHLSSLTITLVYAVYALGVVGSLLLAGHVSDWYGRRAVLIPAVALAAVAAVVFIAWQSLAGLL